MDTEKLLSNYINSKTNYLDDYPEIIDKALNVIQGSISFKLKLAIVLSELITFTSHLRKPIVLHDGTIVPTNAIVFALAGSGESKDKSLNAIRKSLVTAYTQIGEERKKCARDKAKAAARLEGDDEDNWVSYYKAPKALQTGLGTVEGLLQHFYDISESTLGSGSILSSEIGSELQNNNSMVDIIKVLSVAYDLGNIPAKVIKARENQTNEIISFPVNALLFGSHEALLFDNQVKSKFRLVFNTQLARRSLFTFNTQAPKKPKITSIDELYKMNEEERLAAKSAQSELNKVTSEIVYSTSKEPLVIEDAAMKLFDVYLEYNELMSDKMSNKFPISKLSRKHKQWLALKLSGNYAILDGSDTISEKHYAYAINTIELLANDLADFEKELVKETYEQLVDMCKQYEEDGEYFITLHDLRKLGYISGTGASKSKVDELCKLASSCDSEGTYFCTDIGLSYKKLVKTDIVGVSYKIFDMANLKGKALKDYMNRNSSKGYEFFETDFEDIENLLLENAAYSTFQFKGGVHTKEALFGGTKIVVLDIDKSVITDKEAHVLLEEYNHFIVRTSDPDNEFKFRVILELNAVVSVDPITWKCFIIEIADLLGLIVDVLPQSGIILSYKNRTILKQLEGKTLCVKDLLDKATENVKNKPKPATSLPSKEKEYLLKDDRNTFYYAFECESGERSNKIYRALAHAIDLGADKEYVENLALNINSYISNPMDKDRLYKTLLEPALRRI